MGLNCGYAASKPGLFKVVTVVLGFISQGFLWHGVSEATYVKDEYEEKICKALNAAVSTKPCPLRWLVQTAAGLGCVCFWLSLLVLVILLFIELNESGMFNQIDFIGHAIAGICLILAGIFAITFVALAMNHTSCTDQLWEKVCTDGRDKIFRPIEFGIGGALTLVNGFVYLATAQIIKRGS